ncbi:hypothetical protein HZH68_004594 [Vespula germanica]|uniref:Uncharacterized protein n=1 Tax=Vespula germanica TaxID=30212 RepID=A0A834KP36_VESGE|nr:hypothetical protein HZH68_004594 [Vespula germanica]
MRSHSRNRVLVSSLGDGNPLEYDDVVNSSSDCEQEPLVGGSDGSGGGGGGGGGGSDNNSVYFNGVVYTRV